jgi:hypothetical protein
VKRPTLLQEEHEAEEQESHISKDYWVFDPVRNVLQRHHVLWRKALFSPVQADGMPIPLRALRRVRRTQDPDKDSRRVRGRSQR